jgi:hypothetical protein
MAEQKYAKFVSSDNKVTVVDPPKPGSAAVRGVTIIGSGDSEKLVKFLLNSTIFIHPSAGPAGLTNLAVLFSVFGTDWLDNFLMKFLDNPNFDSGDIVIWSGYLNQLKDSRLDKIIQYVNAKSQAAVVKLQQNLGEKEDEKTIEDAIKGSKNRGREPFFTLSAVNPSSTAWAVIAGQLGKGYSVRDLAVNEAKSDSRTSGLIHDALQAALGVADVNITKNAVKGILLKGNVVSPSKAKKGTKPNAAKVKSPSKAAAEEENNDSIYDTMLRGLMPLFFKDEAKAPHGRWEDELIESTIRDAKAKLMETLNGARPNSDNVENSSASSLEKLVPLIEEIMKARKNPDDKNAELVAKLIKPKFLSAADYKRYELESRSLRKEDEKREAAAVVPAKKAGGKLELRPWQSKFIRVITQGQSIIIRGPTSGGKTFASMVALFEVFEQNRNKSLVYVVPAYYQALQVYTNITKTFSTKKIGLITGTVNVTPKDCQAWVGTPIELWTYVSSTQIEGVKSAKSGVKKMAPMTFDIGIFDEIHTISTSYGSGAEAEMRSKALMKLISLIREQFIGLSATIHPEDVEGLSHMAEKLMADGMANEGLKRAPVKLEPSTNYADRPVELKTYNWDGVKYNEFKMGQELVLKEIPITGANTFKLLKALDSNKVSPTLIFDMKESDSYTYFNELVDYLLGLYNKEYSNWIKVKNTLQGPIREFNLVAGAASEANSEIERVQNSENAEKSSKRGKSESKNKGGKSLATDRKQVDECRKNRETLVRSIKDQIISAIRKSEGLEPTKMADASLIEDEEDEEPELFGSPEEKSDELKLPKLASVLFARKAKPADKGIKLRADQPRLSVALLSEKQLKVLTLIMNELPKSVSYETKDLLDEYIKVESSGSGIDPLPYVCESRGSYLNFSGNYYDKIFSEMINPNRNDPKSIAEYNFMLDLTAAEGARSDDVRNIFNLMDVALTFGIGMLLPDMLFAVQDKILGLLNKGKIGVVFVSKGMSMGVNYPARSCVIRCPHLTEVNVCEALQMQGRAGRWGLITDDFALAISWNVRNASSISAETMPHIEYPRDVNLREVGVLVKNPEAAVPQLARSMVFSKNRDALKEAYDSLAQIDAKINLPKQRAKNAGLEQAGRSAAAADFDDDAQEDEHFSFSVRPSRAGAGAGIDHSQLINSVVFTALDIAKESLGLEDADLAVLNSHILAVYEGHDMSFLRDRSEIYTTVERLNVVKQVLQEIHTIYHEFDCKDLLEHIADLFRIIHRVAMKNLGLAYRN